MNQLSQNIRLLGDLLGKIIVHQAGESVFELEESIRRLSKQWHEGDETASAKAGKIVVDMIEDLPLTKDILKAFSTYFQLVNLAEEHQRIHVLKERANDAFQAGQPMDESIAAAVSTLKQEGYTAEQVAESLSESLIMPVFTAHPTESRRRTIRQILRHISKLLNLLQTTPEYQRGEVLEQLTEHITLLWQSDEDRKRKPTVMDEVRNTGLYFFENTLFDVVPTVYEELERSLAKEFPDYVWQVPSVLRFGSWIGGDRDGNPFVTKDTTEAAISAQKDLVLERYAQDVQSLYELLSPALGRVTFDDGFLEALEQEVASLPEDELETIKRFDAEPYRQKLILIYRRLLATLRQNEKSWDLQEPDPRAFSDAGELLTELKAIEKSLLDNRGENLTRGALSDLIRRVQVFGFHLASLDIRQHSKRHESAIAEICEKFKVCNSYSEMSEAERAALLAQETENRRPLTAALDFSDETNETVSLFRLVAKAQKKAGKASVQTYVISMTESVSDVLEVLLLMSDSGLFGELDIVPLFETVDDLNAAHTIMQNLFDCPIYKQHLERRGNNQQIMIGYSDSNKDGGFLRANWMLFAAQRRLAETCLANDIKLTLFHGRGGSIGRGGGPANRAILSQPPESIRGRIRITEQGEVVSSRYTHNEIARRHLQQLFHAMLCSTGRRPEFANLERWSQVVDEVSEIGFGKYRELVERPEFIEYFQTATPIDQIDQLNLGSRPSRRKATQSIGDLRAIPWVFAWTQSRTNIPSWFGVGTAMEAWVQQNGESSVDELKAMYQEWPFFKSVLNNIHLGMGRADIDIAELYSKLVNPEIGGSMFEEIRNEFEKTKSWLLQVTGYEALLDTESWLQHSIRMRNPYVDPMNYIQVALLEKYRKSDDGQLREEIQSAIVQSINGIAIGLQNVG
jgi:phosphoenolpyruvate carboxylase